MATAQSPSAARLAEVRKDSVEAKTSIMDINFPTMSRRDKQTKGRLATVIDDVRWAIPGAFTTVVYASLYCKKIERLRTILQKLRDSENNNGCQFVLVLAFWIKVGPQMTKIKAMPLLGAHPLSGVCTQNQEGNTMWCTKLRGTKERSMLLWR